MESQKGEIKSYRLSDKEAFSLNIGRRVLTSDLLPDGKIPVYSANVFESFGNIDKLLIKDFNLPSVLWGIDGDWMVNFIEKDIPFYPTDHCGVLRVLSNDISPRYVAWVLQNEGKHKGFSRQLRASIDRIEGLTLNLPSYKKQQLVASEVSNIESNIEKQKQSIQVYDNEKNTILKKYL